MADNPSTSDAVLPDIIAEKKRVPAVRKSRKTTITNVLPAKCSICQNAAVGFHYDVASCNGCKAFFRRTVITGRRYRCHYGNNCMHEEALLAAAEDPNNKRTCGACRFAKCEEMGMNPLSIQEELLSDKGKLVKAEMLRKRNIEPMPAQKINVDDELSRALQKLTIAENQLQKLHNSNLPDHHVDLRPLSDLLASHPIFEIDKIPKLSPMEYQVFPDHGGYIHNCFLGIVEHVKLFNFFHLIDPESAKKLVIHGSLICRNMIMSYQSIQDFHSDIVRRQDGSIAGKPLKNYNGVWVEQRKIIQKTLHAFIRNRLDHVEYMLLKAIVFCNPAIPGLPAADQKIIETERIRYARCLLTYCLQQHGKLHGPNRYGSILSTVPIMVNQARELKDFHVILRAFHEKAPLLVSPLYDEIMENS